MEELLIINNIKNFLPNLKYELRFFSKGKKSARILVVHRSDKEIEISLFTKNILSDFKMWTFDDELKKEIINISELSVDESELIEKAILSNINELKYSAYEIKEVITLETLYEFLEFIKGVKTIG